MLQSLVVGSPTILICRSKCTKSKRIARAHLILHARAAPHPPHGHPDFPWGVISCISLGRAGCRKSVSLFSTLFRGSFEAILPFFWSSDVLRDYPESVIRSLRSIYVAAQRANDSSDIQRLRTNTQRDILYVQ